MTQYKYLTPELHELIDRDITPIINQNITHKSKLNLLNEKLLEWEGCIIEGVKSIAEHIDIDKNMPIEELIAKIQMINQEVGKQKKINFNDLAQTVAAIFCILSCENIGHKLYTENVISDCQLMFNKARNTLLLSIEIEEEKSRSSVNNLKTRYKPEDSLISVIISQWLKENQPNIFKFVQENYVEFFKVSRTNGGFIKDEETMHGKMTDYLTKFNALINNEKVHKPRIIIKELAEKHLSTAQ